MRIGMYQSYWGTIGGGQGYMGVAAEVLARAHDVEFVHHREDFDRAVVEDALEVDLSRVRFRVVPRWPRPTPGGGPLSRYRAERDWCREYSAPYDLFVNCSSTPPLFCQARRGVAVVFFPETARDEFQGRRSPQWSNLSVAQKIARRAYQALEWRNRCASYQTYVTISEYSQRWLAERWGVRGAIVYPPLRRGLEPGRKTSLILSIGRFDTSQHKKPEALIAAFKALCDGGLTGWEYVLVGPVDPEPAHLAALDRLRDLARGYPISFRTNVPASELRELLAGAALLWHSMGYGVVERDDPGRLEHFGMVATEAMAAGCVPLLFNGGGLAEIVRDGQDGYLWRTPEELQARTVALASDPQLRERLARAAQVRAQDFSRAAFEQQWLQALAPVLN